jgi:F-type H+-transporting ATPase subunit delta
MSVVDRVVSARYAEALIGAIEDPGQLDAVHEEILAIGSIVRENEQLKAFLEGPSIALREKQGLIRKVFAERVSTTTFDFLRMLLDKHRIDQFAGIVKEFTRLVEERRNQLRVQVTTAIEVGVDVMDRLKRALDASLGKDCILVTTVDSRIVGGVVAIVGDRVIDGSIRTALDDLGKDLIATPLQQRTA